MSGIQRHEYGGESAPVILASIVIPVFRSEKSLVDLHRRLVAVLGECADDYELILVDDGSDDSSWPVILQIAAADDRVRGLKLTRNFGQHPALCAGFRHATGDITVMMDADLEDLPEEVPRILAPLLRDDADIVYTVRDGCRKPWHRELTSRLYHRLFSWLSHSAVPKDVGTMRAFTRKVRSALIQHGERHILYGPLMMSLGFRTRFVSIAHPGHIGKSAYSFRKRLQLAARSLMTYTDMPILILIRCGALMTVGSLAYFLAVIAGYLFHGRQLADGITIAISLLCLLTGMTTFSLGIIGGYIFQIYQEVLSRPRYLIQDSVNLDATFGDNTVPDIPEYNSTHIHSGPAGNPKKLRAPEETVP